MFTRAIVPAVCGLFVLSVLLVRDGPGMWTADPVDPPLIMPKPASVWIRTWDQDPIGPTAVATGPATAERAQPAAFSAAASTDNVDIANMTRTVRANGSVVHGYGPSFTWTPTQTGTFDVGVGVRDAGGNGDDANVSVRLVDTTPPAGPTDLAAAVTSDGGASVVSVTWTSVTADDLKMYAVYRTSDGGTTFTFLGWTDGGSAAFTDASASSGGTYLYRVTAVDRYGNEGAPSLSAQAVVPLPGGGPGPLDLGLVVGTG